MTDARLPERWLTDRRLLLLSDAEFRLFVTALLWCVANRTDGEFGEEDLRLMPGIDPARAAACAAGCAKRSLLAGNGGQWVIADFTATQSSRDELDQLERIRAAERDKKRRQRLSPGQSPGQSPGTAQAGRKAGTKEQQPATNVNPREGEQANRPQCIVPGCEDPARHGLVTCWGHAEQEPPEEIPF